jgi:hypothetical protein
LPLTPYIIDISVILDERDKEVHWRTKIIVYLPELDGLQRRDAHADGIGGCGEVYRYNMRELGIASAEIERRRQVEKGAYHEEVQGVLDGIDEIVGNRLREDDGEGCKRTIYDWSDFKARFWKTKQGIYLGP